MRLDYDLRRELEKAAEAAIAGALVAVGVIAAKVVWTQLRRLQRDVRDHELELRRLHFAQAPLPAEPPVEPQA